MLRLAIRKGNQQPLAAGGYLIGNWFKTTEDKLVNLELAQAIEILQIDKAWVVLATYNDASEVRLASYNSQKEAQALLDQIEQAFDVSRRAGVQQPTGEAR